MPADTPIVVVDPWRERMPARPQHLAHALIAYARQLSPVEFEALIGNPLREASDDELYAALQERLLSDPRLGPDFIAEALAATRREGSGAA